MGTDPHNPDTDGDGLPDGWETDHRLDPLTNDAADDPDGDGFSNAEEFAAGTDPQDPASHPRPGDGGPDPTDAGQAGDAGGAQGARTVRGACGMGAPSGPAGVLLAMASLLLASRRRLWALLHELRSSR